MLLRVIHLLLAVGLALFGGQRSAGAGKPVPEPPSKIKPKDGATAGKKAKGGADPVRKGGEEKKREIPDVTHPTAENDEFKTEVVAPRPLVKDRTADAVSIAGKKLEESPKATMVESLSQENAGIYVTGRGVGLHGVAGGASGGIYIRGLGGSPNAQILMVEDGVPDYQGIFGHPIPDAFIPFLIDEVLVIKGGDSVLYGTNAMGGVVILRSRWREKEGFEISNDFAYGSYSTSRETLSFLGKFKRFDVACAFHILDTEGHREGAGGRTMVAHAAARYRITSDLSLVFKNKLVHLEGTDPGPVTHPHEDHFFDVWRENVSLSLSYRRSIFRLSVIPYLNMGIHRLYDGFYSEDYIGGLIAESTLRIRPGITLLLGLGSEYTDGVVEDRVAGERNEIKGIAELSFYNQLTLKPVSRLNIVLGTRQLYNSAYGWVMLYKAGINLMIYKGLFARSQVVRNFRKPTIRELYLPFPTSNPDLKPEYALNCDLAIGYVSERFEITVTGYRTEAQNMIRYFGAWPTAEVINIDEIEIWGVEGKVGVNKLGPVSIKVSGNWQHVGRYTRQNPSLKLNFELSAGHSFGYHFVGGALTGEWVHGLFMDNYERNPMDDVFYMDLNLRYRFKGKGRKYVLEPYLILRNFIDRKYAYIDGYPMPGFNVMAGLRITI